MKGGSCLGEFVLFMDVYLMLCELVGLLAFEYFEGNNFFVI